MVGIPYPARNELRVMLKQAEAGRIRHPNMGEYRLPWKGSIGVATSVLKGLYDISRGLNHEYPVFG